MAGLGGSTFGESEEEEETEEDNGDQDDFGEERLLKHLYAG